MEPACKELVFFHSAICPRCRITAFALRRVLARHPEVELTKVELLTNRARAKQAGVGSIPALVGGGRSLTGFVLTPARIERFVRQLHGEPG